jgi:peptidoglycan hydrolase-like protein with peptidoglycan-binding domain
MRSSREKTAAVRAEERESWPAGVIHAMGWGPRDAVALAVALAAVCAIVINALFMQVGPHPAPMFNTAGELPPAGVNGTTGAVATRVSPLLPFLAKPDPARAARPAAEIVADIQRELARRGFFDGVVDGRHGPRTDAAIRDFQIAAGMPPGLDATEDLLAAIRHSSVKALPRTGSATTPRTPGVRPPQTVHGDPIAEVLTPSKRVLALQRALAGYGYGQIKPTGILDSATRAAIEKFERERKLPITGDASDRVLRELSAAIGRPVE